MLAEGVALYEGLPERWTAILDELEEKGVSLRAASDVANRSPEWARSVRVGASKDPAAIPLAKVCERFGYNIRWLVTGLGPKYINRAEDAAAALERRESEPATRPKDAELARLGEIRFRKKKSKKKPSPQVPVKPIIRRTKTEHG